MRTLCTALLLAGGLPALAQDGLEIIGRPVPGGTGFQPAATSLARGLHSLDHLVLVIITLICILVVGLITVVILRYNRRTNPTPATFTHNTPVEIVWTLGPILIQRSQRGNA